MAKTKIDRQKAIRGLREEAEARVVKDEVMRFRLDSDTLKRLLHLAKKLNKPAGSLVREWVIERLEQAELGAEQTPEFLAINIIASSLAAQGILRDEQICEIQQLFGNRV